MNTYLSEMSNIALQYGGTIDKFIGDAILVFFGDPETEGDRNDALKCARMAIRMRERVKELQSVWHENGISKPLRVRIGINTGFCTVGNFGSEHRLEYTALGSPVNLASQLQTTAEADTILMSEATHVLIEDLADCVWMPDLTAKGFARPVATFRLNGVKDDDQAAIQRMTRIGRHVAVDIPDARHIRESIEELRNIQGELEKHLVKD
jgi:adenylate cyclase